MTKNSTRFLLTVFALGIITSGCEHMQADVGSAPGETPKVGAAPATGPNQIAHGAQGDSLEACLARIPANATASQKMLAETTCQQDAKRRSLIEQVPGK